MEGHSCPKESSLSETGRKDSSWHRRAQRTSANTGVPGKKLVSHHQILPMSICLWIWTYGWRRCITSHPATPAPPGVHGAYPFQVQDLAAVLDEPACSVVLLLVRTGLRAGELLALRWGNVDVKAGLLRVCETVYDGHFDPSQAELSAFHQRGLSHYEADTPSLNKHTLF